jgi:hypothetical protein
MWHFIKGAKSKLLEVELLGSFLFPSISITFLLNDAAQFHTKLISKRAAIFSKEGLDFWQH